MYTMCSRVGCFVTGHSNVNVRARDKSFGLSPWAKGRRKQASTSSRKRPSHDRHRTRHTVATTLCCLPTSEYRMNVHPPKKTTWYGTGNETRRTSLGHGDENAATSFVRPRLQNLHLHIAFCSPALFELALQPQVNANGASRQTIRKGISKDGRNFKGTSRMTCLQSLASSNRLLACNRQDASELTGHSMT